MRSTKLYVGVAGWALRKEHQPLFPAEGSHLQRFAGRFNAVEINSSFYKPHRRATYARWREETLPHFRFAVKTPREITHYQRLRNAGSLLEQFLSEATALEEKLGPLLVQLPPQLPLDAATAEAFFARLRELFEGAVACEPRHHTWFTEHAEELLKRYRIARVAADPPRAEEDGQPGGDPSLAYFRLHGSPKIYYSPYDEKMLDEIATRLRRAMRSAQQTWCIFDNTAEGQAVTNAFELVARLG